jgi:hypothetical protein
VKIVNFVHIDTTCYKFSKTCTSYWVQVFLHDQYWVQQLGGRRTQAMKITSNQRRQTAATAAWK